MTSVKKMMSSKSFRNMFQVFHRTKAFISGLQATVPAAGWTGQLTCRTTSSMFRVHTYTTTATKSLQMPHAQLAQVKPVLLEQRRNIRKIYPDPFDVDPDSYKLPQEDYRPEIDVYHVPELNSDKNLVEKVKETIKGDNLGRLFAVVHIDGKQRKITTEDLLVINGFFPPQIGDKIRLEKVMIAGSKDFTLVGRPLLNRDMVNVEATVIEKTLSHVKVNYIYKKKYRRFKLLQNRQTIIVINSIEMNPDVLS